MTRLAVWADRVQVWTLLLLLLLLPISKAAIEITFGILLIAWCVKHAPTLWRSSVWRRAPAQSVGYVLLAYAGACALSIPVSSHPELSLRGFVGKTLEYLLFGVIVADIATLPGVWKRCLRVFLVSAGIIALWGMMQELFHANLLMGRMSGFGRMTGPYENPIDLAMYIVVVLPIVVAYTWSERGAWRWAGWTVAGALLWCLIRTEAQGSWLGLLGAVGISCLLWSRLRRAVMVVLVVATILGGLSMRAESQGLPRVLRFWDQGARDRVVMWKAAWGMFRARPLYGHGINTFMANYLDYWVGGERQPRYAHNCFLQVAAETGLVGLITFVWVLGACLHLWWSGIQRAAVASSARMALIGMWVGLCGFILQASIDTSFYSLRQATLFWVLAGLATGLVTQVWQRRSPTVASV